ncbi:MAG TPA: hypothetical protein VK145_00905 [Candidatus Nanoarchaeia archaeon]|nr:hypothetical protein [Candidatus Nanoarchaeia archaeon]
MRKKWLRKEMADGWLFPGDAGFDPSSHNDLCLLLRDLEELMRLSREEGVTAEDYSL